MKLIQELCCMNILAIKYFIYYFHVILNTFVRFQDVNMQLFAENKLFFMLFIALHFKSKKSCPKHLTIK